MQKNANNHMNIINNSEKFISSLENLFYANSNEKSVLRDKLKKILAGQHYKHAIDIGAGPGLVASVLEQHADNLTLLEIKPEYYAELKTKFPNATIKIQSILDFNFDKKYDLILLSHVLYYIAKEAWPLLLSKLLNNLDTNGKLILTHAPCHQVHKIFSLTDIAKNSQIAYMDEQSFTDMLRQLGPYEKDHYRSLSYYHGTKDHSFAQQFLGFFHGIEEGIGLQKYSKECAELLALFSIANDNLALEYHTDIYIFNK